jgi:hypothetical protein
MCRHSALFQLWWPEAPCLYRPMIVKGWIWKPIIAGLSGTIVHFVFMYLKSRIGLLPSFQPYHSFQTTLSYWVGANVPVIVPWLLSFLNGMTILGFLFGRLNRLLPGRTGAIKGLTFGLIGWVMMGLIFFPVIGLGPFAIGVGLGIAPAMLSLDGADLQHSAGHGVCRARFVESLIVRVQQCLFRGSWSCQNVCPRDARRKSWSNCRS